MPDSELELIEKPWSELARRRRSFDGGTDRSTDIETVLLLAGAGIGPADPHVFELSGRLAPLPRNAR